jgi:hypothetical protein
MVKARVSGVPYEVDLPENKASSTDVIFTINHMLIEMVKDIEAKHMEEIAILEHEIKLVRARNERLEREANNPLPK